MQVEERNNKLITADEAATQLDLLRRDYGYGRGGAHEPDETHLRDYWRIIRRRLWVPMTVMILAVTLTTIYNLRLPSIYEGVTRIEIAGKDRVVNLKDIQLNLGGSEDPAYLATQLKILESPNIAYRVAKALELDRNRAFMADNKAPRPAGKLAISEDDANERAEMERLRDVINGLLGNVKFTPVRDTHLVDIRFRHTDTEMARKIADKWAEVFILNDTMDRRRANRQSADFLNINIAEYKLKLRNADEKLFNYTRDHKVVTFDSKENPVQSRLAALNQMLLNAEQDRKGSQAAYELSRSLKDPTTIPEIQKDTLVQEIGRRLSELRQNREKLLVEYTEEWPEVKTVNQQIAQLEGELRAAHQRILSTIENLYKSAAQKESGLRTAYKQQESVTLDQSQDSIMAKMLQAEVDTNRNMLNTLQARQAEVEVSAAALVTTNMFVRNYAPQPAIVAPNRMQNILLSLLLSLLGGVALVLFLDYINNKIDSVEDIDRYLRLPALGVIPVFEQPKARKALASGEESDSRELVTINNGNNGNNGSVILTQVESNSSIAESYRQLRTSLLLSSAGHAPRTLLVTSSQPAEGKTTTSVNTAISLAQTGASVLIVDADLRRPRVHKIFNLKNNVGLCNYLAGDCDLASLIQIAMPNLYVLPVGPLPPNPAELLGSSKMKIVVETLASNFDYVVIDSPPVSSFADSLILSSLVEGVIIVVRSGFTPREMAQRTKAHLQSVGAKILGVVINQIKLQPHDYYYYSSYYSRYYYSGGDSERDSAVGAD
ncbi:MAG: polysaccharide biosynthesis tyrosine autokinase [Acidobacteria bacterium]|nr:polysaccharide biosynthesis tyrosine autokinase [Acidobacteriota bacterium]